MTIYGSLRIVFTGISGCLVVLAAAGVEAESHPPTEPRTDTAEVAQPGAVHPAVIQAPAPDSTGMSPKNERTFRHGRINAGIIAPSILLVFGGASGILFWQASESAREDAAWEAENDHSTGWHALDTVLMEMAAVTCLVVGLVGSITFLSIGLAMVHRAREREEALRLKRENASGIHIRFFLVATGDVGGGGLALDF